METELRELYQQLIIDHGKKPRNFGVDNKADYIKEGYNPLCGDQLTLYIQAPQGHIEKVSFAGSGCAISMASASLLTQAVIDYDINDLQNVFDDFNQLVTKGADEQLSSKLGKLAALGGVAEFPSRVKCATLAWHAAISALTGDSDQVTTE